MQRKSWILITLLLILALGLSTSALAQEPTAAAPNAVGTAFTYQGQLKDTNGTVSGNCDFHFGLWNALSGGTQVGATLEQTDIAVSEGLFAALLDFGVNAFDGNPRWLEIAVRCPSGSGDFTTLAPRQPLSPAPYSLYSANADTLDGLHASAFQQQHYQNLVVVAKSGGDFTTITAALDSITTNRAGNPFTIYVAPGVYTETVTMKPYVDIEGAGEQATKITHAGWVSSTFGTVMGADNAELRFLTVENTGGADFAAAIYNTPASPRITHVTAIAVAGATNSIGVYNDFSSPTLTDVTVRVQGAANNVGIYNNYFSSPDMTNVTVVVSDGTENYGVSNFLSSPTMINVTITAFGGTNNYGIWNDSSSITVQSSNIKADGGTTSNGIVNEASGGSYTLQINSSQITSGASTIHQGSSYTTRIGASQLAGANVFGSGYTCVATYDENYAPLNSSCQP